MEKQQSQTLKIYFSFNTERSGQKAITLNKTETDVTGGLKHYSIIQMHDEIIESLIRCVLSWSVMEKKDRFDH